MTPPTRRFTDEVLSDAMAAVLRGKTPAERLAVAFGMWDFAEQLIRRTARAAEPGLVRRGTRPPRRREDVAWGCLNCSRTWGGRSTRWASLISSPGRWPPSPTASRGSQRHRRGSRPHAAESRRVLRRLPGARLLLLPVRRGTGRPRAVPVQHPAPAVGAEGGRDRRRRLRVRPLPAGAGRAAAGRRGLRGDVRRPGGRDPQEAGILREGGSEKHLRDVVGVLKVQAGGIDRAYLADWVARLGLAAEWALVAGRLAG